MKCAAKALIRDYQGKILVLYRSETHPYLAHDIDLPGGEIDDDETVEEGLEREIFEETGLRVRIRPTDKTHDWQAMFGQAQMLYETRTAGQERVDISWEHESYVWMSEQEFIEQTAIDEFMHEVQEWLRESKKSLAGVA